MESACLSEGAQKFHISIHSAHWTFTPCL